MSQQKFNKIADKHVLIIGGSSGIGFGVAEGSIEAGARVTIASSNSARVESAIKALQSSYPKAKVAGHVCDLSKSTVEKDIEDLFAKTGTVDHIVYTSGDKLAVKSIYSISLEDIKAAGQVRFFAPLLVAKVGSKFLSPGPTSSITLTTGAVAEQPHQDWTMVASYAAGLHGMTRNLALDLKPIRVNLVSPGAIDTDLWHDLAPEKKQEMFKSLRGKLPTGRIGLAEDIAEAYLWLMKDKNATGVVVSSESGARLV